MAIVASDIKIPLSGGAANSNPNLALGGAASSTELTDNTDNNLFDDVSAAESLAGDVEYRGLYVKNGHGSLTLGDARIYFTQATTSADTELDLGIAVEAVGVSMATIADEQTAPVGVTFSRPTNYAGGAAINSSTGLVAGGQRGVWFRRTVNAGAAAAAADTGIFEVQGSTSA